MLVLVVWSSSMLFVGILDCGGELIVNASIMVMLVRCWLAFVFDSERVSRKSSEKSVKR